MILFWYFNKTREKKGGQPSETETIKNWNSIRHFRCFHWVILFYIYLYIYIYCVVFFLSLFYLFSLLIIVWMTCLLCSTLFDGTVFTSSKLGGVFFFQVIFLLLYFSIFSAVSNVNKHVEEVEEEEKSVHLSLFLLVLFSLIHFC